MFNYELLEILNLLAMLFPAMLVIFTIRGFFKALVSKWMGDDTAYMQGFLTLNPIVHINIVGLLAVLFILYVVGGILPGLISRILFIMMLILFGVRLSVPVPINESNFKKHSLGVVFTTLVTPISSFFIAFIFMYITKYFPFSIVPTYVYKSFIEVFSFVIEFSIFFGVLDLIPIPPFSSGRLLRVILPKSWQGGVVWLNKNSSFIFLFLFFMPVVSDYFLGFISLFSLIIKISLSMLVF